MYVVGRTRYTVHNRTNVYWCITYEERTPVSPTQHTPAYTAYTIAAYAVTPAPSTSTHQRRLNCLHQRRLHQHRLYKNTIPTYTAYTYTPTPPIQHICCIGVYTSPAYTDTVTPPTPAPPTPIHQRRQNCLHQRRLHHHRYIETLYRPTPINQSR